MSQKVVRHLTRSQARSMTKLGLIEPVEGYSRGRKLRRKKRRRCQKSFRTTIFTKEKRGTAASASSRRCRWYFRASMLSARTASVIG